MKISKNLFTKTNIVIVLAITFVTVCLILGPLGGIGYIMWDVEKGKQREIRLLCETDYQTLLRACRELSRRVTTGDLIPNHYRVRQDPHPEASSFPQPILDLKPTYVMIDSKRKVMIELHGGFLHYGVMAYPEDYKEPGINSKYGDKKLIDGLWYYNEDYEESPKLQKKIDKLIQKGKMRQIEKNAASVSNEDGAP
ncbi:MAG: hypothetical protein HQ580_03275 [Planctomycetes bacterium]|nr:hypothetical protein [Planctomycetota bacterium]